MKEAALDPRIVPEHAWTLIRQICIKQGLPESWVHSSEFTDNVIRTARSFGPYFFDILCKGFSVVNQDFIFKKISQPTKELEPLNSLLLLARLASTLALDQPLAAFEPYERFPKTPGYTPPYAFEYADLTEHRFAHQFFYHHQTESHEPDEAAIDRALAGLDLDVLAIGSGPGCATALAQMLDRYPQFQALVLDRGDYFTQDAYLKRSPTGVIVDAYKDSGVGVIVNSSSRITAQIAPQVFGGGAEIFSGTFHTLPLWYQSQMPISKDLQLRYEQQIRHECHVGTTPWKLITESQQLFFKAAEKSGLKPFALEGFGRLCETGTGRCHAGKKGRIPYLDRMFLQGKNIRGIANCLVQKLYRNNAGFVEAIELSFLSRTTRQPIATRLLSISPKTIVLLGAGCFGNHRILKESGDPVAHQLRPSVIHQHTCEIPALFDRPLDPAGIPQATACVFKPDQELADGTIDRRVMAESADPGRAIVASVGLTSGHNRLALAKRAPYLNHAGVMSAVFTESQKGVPVQIGQIDTMFQRLTQKDFDNLFIGIDSILDVYKTIDGFMGVSCNTSKTFPSRHQDLQEIGFAGRDELESYKQFLRRYPPTMQVFYRTGHRFGTLDADTGRVHGFKNVYLMGEDTIPPGPGVNPTLAMMLLSKGYADNILA